VLFSVFGFVTVHKAVWRSASDSWSVDTCQSWVWAPSKAHIVSLSKKLLSLLSTGWVQERIRAWFT